MTDPFEKGSELVILCPSSRRLTLGLGSDASPIDFPNVVAYRTAHPPNTTAATYSQYDLGNRQKALDAARYELGLTHEHPTATVRVAHDQLSNGRIVQERVLTGEAVLKLKGSESYSVIYPCGLGGLDPSRSGHQLRIDLGHIWTSAIEHGLRIDRTNFSSYGAVLIVPDDYGLGDVEVMIDTIFSELCFKDIVVHSDSTAAVFGQGISGGCIVHVEDTSVRISCIEDGVLGNNSLKRLPFGARHIANCLEWMIADRLPGRRHDSPHHRHQWDAIRDATCFLLSEGPISALESEIRHLPSMDMIVSGEDDSETVWSVSVGTEACLAPMGLFFPDLLLSHSVGVDRQRISRYDDYYSQLSSDGEAASNQLPISMPTATALDAAIVASISSADSVDHRRHLYTSILIAGPCSHMKGLPDMVERRVLSALPCDEVIDTVAVLEPKWLSHHLIWKGGCVMGILSDHWVKQKEWNQETEKPSRFGKREFPKSKALWMFKTETGRM